MRHHANAFSAQSDFMCLRYVMSS